MQRVIELKHVGPKAHVRRLIEDLIDRLEEKLQHFPQEATSIHVLFEANGTHKLFHASLACHIPGRMVAAHEEDRDPGATIHAAFEELERQLLKYSTLLQGKQRRRKAGRSAATPLPESESA